jgi:aspartyl-tRNA synthetase
LDFAHNPFGVWKEEEGLSRLQTLQKAKENNTLTDLRAIQYDLTLNGYEVLSGGVRNSNPAALMEAFLTVGYTEEEVRGKFRHMMEAYEYAAPPHAGFAWGLDRLFMVLMDEDNIREIIAFPKNGQGIDAMTGSPNEVAIKQLKELSIQTLG